MVSPAVKEYIPALPRTIFPFRSVVAKFLRPEIVAVYLLSVSLISVYQSISPI